MRLIVGTDSTWSLRAWMCGRLAGVKFEVYVVDLSDAGYQEKLAVISDTGLVPVLNDKDLNVHDSLAIAEYFNDLTNGSLYPSSISEKALARSLCAELHSGFINLRVSCPFTLEPAEPLTNCNGVLNRELKRIEEIFGLARRPFMFGAASIVDAFYAVLAYRLKTYGVIFESEAGDYQKDLLKWPILLQAISIAHEWKNK